MCGEVTFVGQKRTITPLIQNTYFLYFGCQIGDQDKSWEPHICWNNCASNIRNWINGKDRSMPFTVPMIWRESKDHFIDCYFCLVPPLKQGISKKKNWALMYPNLQSAVRPIPHREGLPVPEPPDKYQLEAQVIIVVQKTLEFSVNFSSVDPHKITQNELSYLIRDLELSKVKAEVLA
ncbi:hypothetical protein PR048_018140 [Dryococelus australis]|uniref:Uncharacterized protein n=1 Tax=Dryococelus australis TaxID=614101 RepID=A0ABQ9HBK8_9NEOP|nr:hypothetical protein PR048_018140 [Dryococelus australis]